MTSLGLAEEAAEAPSIKLPDKPDVADEPAKQEEDGFLMRNTPLNALFQHLAKEAGRSYIHNPKLNGPEFMVTGHLNAGDPIQQMKDISFMYGVHIVDGEKELALEPPIASTEDDKATAEAEVKNLKKKEAKIFGNEAESGEGDSYNIVDAGLNDILQFLSKRGGLQYFHNPRLNNPYIRVTGHLGNDEPLESLKALAKHFDLQVYVTESTVYVLTDSQAAKLLPKK